MNKVAQLVDYLANMHKALSLSPSNTNPRHSSNVSVIQHSGRPRGHGLLSLCNPALRRTQRPWPPQLQTRFKALEKHDILSPKQN